jgi:hypothetical protein
MRKSWQRVGVEPTAAADRCRGGGVDVVDGIPSLQRPPGSDRWLGFCGRHCSTSNVGCMPDAPCLFLELLEGGGGAQPRMAGRGIRTSFPFLGSRGVDLPNFRYHISNILPFNLDISYLTFN